MSLNKLQLIHAMSLLSIDDIGVTQTQDQKKVVYVSKQKFNSATGIASSTSKNGQAMCNSFVKRRAKNKVARKSRKINRGKK
jgi:hypothetical protein